MDPIALTHLTLTSCLGTGREAHRLRQSTSGLKPCTFPGAEHVDTWVGSVDQLDQFVLPEALTGYNCRNHRLAWLALQQDDFLAGVGDAVAKYGAHRVGVIVGTSTSGIEETEHLYREFAQQVDLNDIDTPSMDRITVPDWYNYHGSHNVGALARFVSAVTGAQGYQLAISTACSSSAKVFASAARALQADLCDAVVVGGVDSLCLTTLCGFSSLQLTATDVCRPCDADRSGISIGEAGGFALLGRTHEGINDQAMALLLGYGESADAHHMSSPHPQGEGAQRAMQAALVMAGVQAKDVDYVNLHGTGTPANDISEAIAVATLLGEQVPCSSTKGFVGHTLGACGIVEAAICIDAMEQGVAPRNEHLRTKDPDIPINVLAQDLRADLRVVLSNSFGFGGSNCSLALGTAR